MTNLDKIIADHTVPASNEKVKQLRDAVLNLQAAEQEYKRLVDLTGKAKTAVHILKTDTVPSIMDEIGVPLIGVPGTDRTVKIETVYKATLPKDTERRAAALKWVDEHGYGDTIANTITVNFPKGEEEIFHRVFDRLVQMLAQEDSEADMVQDNSIHWKTYTRIVKEEATAGHAVPFDELGAFVLRQAKLS